MNQPRLRRDNAWRRYVSSLAELRLTLEQNELDYQYGRTPGRIVYLFDANVVRLFLKPANETDHILSFGLSSRHDDLVATAMITAEFLFSRNLSGQGGLPPYITQAHAEDLLSIVRRLEKQVSNCFQQQSTARVGEIGDARSIEKVVSLVEQVRHGALEERKAISLLSDLVPTLASSLFDSGPYEARQFRRVIGDDMLRPLQLLPQATEDVLRPDPRIVNSWQDLLRTELSTSRSRSAGSGAGPHLENRLSRPLSIRRDATTLSQLQLLNEAARNSIQPIKYVLVTTDRVMIRAYTRAFLADDSREWKEYALRHPSQYVPILNAEQMQNGVVHSDLFNQVRDAIDGLFRPLVADDRAYMRTLAELADPSLGTVDTEKVESGLEVLRWARDRSGEGAVRQVQQRWAEAARGAVLLNSPMLTRHFDRGWKDVLSVIEHEKGIQQGILHYLDNLLSNVEASHADFLVHGFLDLHTGSSAPPTGDASRPRLLLRSADPHLKAMLKSATIEELERAVVEWRGEVGRRVPPEFSGDYMAFFVAAYVSYRVEKWASAQFFCRRADEIINNNYIFGRSWHNSDKNRSDGDPLFDRHEIFYLEARANIFRGNRDIRRSIEQLDESLVYYRSRDDRFGIVRTLVERSGLGLSLWLLRDLHRDSKPVALGPSEIAGFVQAADHIWTAVREVPELLAKDERSLTRRLANQTWLVCLASAIYDIKFARTDSFSVETLTDLCNSIEEVHRDGFWPSSHVLVLANEMARWTIGESPERDRAWSRARRALSQMEGQPAGPIERWLVDRVQRWEQRA